ncbi:hypothetical protein [Paenibacillus sp. PL2-23]|uniref:hypothetical protein n=1 Tax=Paenibacillus sp. PL2-23 TaxID=2100729 RepID=UPI0030FD9163
MKIKSKYIIIILTICLGIMSLLLVESQRQKKGLQDAIDRAYVMQLNNVLGSFSMIVNDYTYRSMISDVSKAATNSELTSYKGINDELDISIYNLFIALREDKST